MNESLKLILEEGNLNHVLTVIFYYVEKCDQQIHHLMDLAESTQVVRCGGVSI